MVNTPKDCPTCGRPILYARLDDGRTIILDDRPTDSGGVAVTESLWGLRARLTSREAPIQPYERAYVAHAVVCQIPAPRRAPASSRA